MACAVERVGTWVGGGAREGGLDLETTSSSSSGASGASGASGGGSGSSEARTDGSREKAFRPWGPPEDDEEDDVICSSPSPVTLLPPPPPPPPPPPRPLSRTGGVRGQRNYKNMTRERRMEANARERSRVHTISAAFETLRRAVPAYSHNQKLSKLSVLRVAASYILTLSRVLGEDYSPDQSSPSVAQCVDNVTNTIQMEGKLRKRKED